MSTGAADDLNKATEIARNMVVRFGMTLQLGQVTYEPETAGFLGPGTAAWQPRRYGEATAAVIDLAVKDLIDKAFGRAVSILETNRLLLDRSAKELLIKETFSNEDLEELRRSIILDSSDQEMGGGIGRAAAVSLAPN